MRLKPFAALLPRVDMVERVASVPYDIISTAEAREAVRDNPYSFLHVVRPEIDLPAGTDIHSDAAYARAGENLSGLREQGILVPDDRPCLYVYRLSAGEHVQRGIVACCHVDDYASQHIRVHEATRADKEKDRTRHILALQAHSGPVFLTYRDNETIDRLVAAVELDEPTYRLRADHDVEHTIWRVPENDALVQAFGDVPFCYIADGHHRTAAAVRVARECAQANRDHTGEEEYNWFLAGIFPAGQLRVLPYNRCVRDLNGMEPDAFVQALEGSFTVKAGAAPGPSAPGKASMYLAGTWYGLEWTPEPDADTVEALDVSYLQRRLVGPVLGVHDPRCDPRIAFVGGIRGTRELERLVDSGRAAVAFSMCPVSVDQIMSVSDVGKSMPPKSTWFEPKLLSGLFVHTF